MRFTVNIVALTCALVLAQVFVVRTALAQTPLQNNLFGAEQGLTSRQITSLLEDKYGFLWLGTEDGLFRWDGVSMKAFTHQTGDSTSLPSNAVLHIHEDKRGRIWVGTAAGLAEFHRAAENFSRYLHEKPVADIHEDSRGQLWCWVHQATLNADEIALLNTQSGSESRFREGLKGLRSAYLYSFLETKQGAIWLGTTNGLHRFDQEKQNFTAFLTDATSPTSPATAPTSHILSLAEDANENLYVGTGKGLFLANKNPSAFQPFLGANGTMLLREAGIVLLHKDRTNTVFAAAMQRKTRNDAANTLVWINTREGAMTSSLPVVPCEGKSQSHRTASDASGNLLWGVGNGIIRLTFSLSGKTSLFRAELIGADEISLTRINAAVTSIVASASGAILFARINSGVSAIPPPRQPFRAITNLLSPNVSALGEAPDGSVWLGYMSGAGASRIDRSTMTFTHFRQDPKNPASLRGYNGETNVYAFYGTKNGDWFVGSYFLERLLGQGFEHKALIANEIAPTTAMVEDRNGNLWIGSTFGLFLADKAGSVQKRFVHNPNDDASLGNNNIHALALDSAGLLWIGHDGGADRFDPSSKRLRRFTAASGLASGTVTSIVTDGKGRVWIGTRGGLTIFDPLQNDFTMRFSKREGLPNDAVAGISEDFRGNIWISTRKGLCRINPESLITTCFSGTDGIVDEEFSEGAALRTKDGRLWFGARSAVVHFHPDSIRQLSSDAKEVSARAVITGLKKFGERAVLPDFIGDASSIELGYDDKVIALEYRAPSAFYPENVRYAYKLEGLDTSWLLGGKEQEAKYTNLPEGRYTFLVKASNANGLWQETPTQIVVIVRPPWWRTWWFLGVGVIVLGVGTFSFYQWRIRSIQSRNRDLERIVGERTESLQAANAEVNRQLEILDEQATEIEISNTRLQEVNLQLDTTLSRLKETQTQLVQSERINAAGMLTAGVMHEINNPNASIYSALELGTQQLKSLRQHFLSLLDPTSRESAEATTFVEMIAKIQDILNVALNGSERIRLIVTSLQGFTKHQQEGASENDIKAEIHTTATMFRYQFKDVEVEEIVAADIHLAAQWSEINQAMLNLLVNAAQAGAKHILIGVEAGEDGKSVIISVRDNGQGMSAEIKNRIFEPFFTTKSVGNTGLGLSITRQIIERHGGTIRVESEVGKGTTFTIILPKAESSLH